MNLTSKHACLCSGLLLLVVIGYTAGSALTYSAHARSHEFTSASAPEEHVTILDVFQSGSQISIMLNYNFSSTAQLGTDGYLAVFLVFRNVTSSAPETAMLFFHTADDNFSLFWMAGDPYHQAQFWQQSKQFQVNHNLLSMDFIEFLEITNPDIQLVVLAKILTGPNTNLQIGDFQSVLEEFGTDLYVGYGFIVTTKTTTETSTGTTSRETSISSTTTAPSFIPGFTLLAMIGVLVSLSVIVRNRQRQ
ncbi:MAG: hypothetical protein ACFFD4_22815 [Candidatus Odinarchaeota archaeon]